MFFFLSAFFHRVKVAGKTGPFALFAETALTLLFPSMSNISSGAYSLK